MQELGLNQFENKAIPLILFFIIGLFENAERQITILKCIIIET